MMTTEEFRDWSISLELSKETYTLIEQIRSSPPSRRVGGGRGNVSGRYPSQKNGVIIQFESHHNELAGIYEMEYDPEVLEYYDQAPKIKLVYRAKNGKQIGVLHTPDFFVISKKEAGWQEWKTQSELELLIEKMPNRYQLDSNGKYRCPPGEEFAANYGLYYRLRTDKEINWIYTRNLYFLSDYLTSKSEIVPVDTENKIVKIVDDNPGIKVSDLIDILANSDYIYKLIAMRKIYVDLSKFALADNKLVIPVYLDKFQSDKFQIESSPQQINGKIRVVPENLQVGLSGIWNGELWDLINQENGLISLSNQKEIIKITNDNFQEMIEKNYFQLINVHSNLAPFVYDSLKKASESDYIEALRRYQIISSYLGGEEIDSSIPRRTFYRWVSSWRKAEKEYGCGYLGLLPHNNNKGNQSPRLPLLTQEMIENFIDSDYENPKQKSKFAVYCALKKACDENGTIVPSYLTFLKNIKKRPQYEQKLKRAGKRVAYENEPFYWSLDFTTPKHGDRPFEICHIDHTLLDIELISSRNSINLGRPWLTFLTDAYSRRILAIYLTFDPPSYRSCMMILRECVRRHGRLPQSLVVDGGKEFQSVYFEKLLAAYCCIKKTRPAAKPRFGSVCERVFGSANSMFIHNLQGNTQITRNVREVTKSVNPRNLAIWTLSTLYQNLCDWAYEFYDNKEHPALNQSPKEAFTQGFLNTGMRSHKIIKYDDNFRIFTLPTTDKGTAKVILNNGVKINNIYYWHNLFNHPEIENTSVPVRYDPYDIGIAYSYVKGEWRCCISQHYTTLAGHSEKEIMLASLEIRKQYQNQSKNFSITAYSLANFLTQAEQQENILLQRIRDIETKDILSNINCDENITELQLPSEVLSPVIFELKENEEIKPYDEFW